MYGWYGSRTSVSLWFFLHVVNSAELPKKKRKHKQIHGWFMNNICLFSVRLYPSALVKLFTVFSAKTNTNTTLDASVYLQYRWVMILFIYYSMSRTYPCVRRQVSLQRLRRLMHCPETVQHKMRKSDSCLRWHLWKVVRMCRGTGRGWVTVTSYWLSLEVQTEFLWLCPYTVAWMWKQSWMKQGRKPTEGSTCSVMNRWICPKTPNCQVLFFLSPRSPFVWLNHQNLFDVDPAKLIGAGPVCSTALKGDMSVTGCERHVGGLCTAADTHCEEMSVLKDTFHLCNPFCCVLLLNEVMAISVFLSIESVTHCKSKQPGRNH